MPRRDPMLSASSAEGRSNPGGLRLSCGIAAHYRIDNDAADAGLA